MTSEHESPLSGPVRVEARKGTRVGRFNFRNTRRPVTVETIDGSRSRKSRLVKTAAALLTGAAIGGTTAVYITESVDARNDSKEQLVQVELNQLEHDRVAAAEMSRTVIVLHEGVELRKTPGVVDSSAWNVDILGWQPLGSSLSGNLLKTVASGQNIAVASPRVLKNSSGAWLGFRADQDNKTLAAHLTTPQIADQYGWVNVNKLSPDNASMTTSVAGELVPFNRAMLEQSTGLAALQPDGFYEDSNHNRQALAH